MNKDHRERRHRRIRARISGVAAVPRVSVFRSNRHLFVQLIDDAAGKTIIGISGATSGAKTKMEEAVLLGAAIARAAKEHHVGRVVFDRGGYAYHGRVKALAEAMRKDGLSF